MLTRISQHLFERSVSAAYSRRLREKGASAEGVFWASRLSQTARFDHILRQVSGQCQRPGVSLADIGCGYGALLDFIRKTDRYQHFSYHGYDITPAMISYCHQHHPQGKSHFTLGRRPVRAADFAVFIGTFNLCHCDDYALWQDYIIRQLSLNWERVTTGMALNITSLRQPIIKNRIFYAEPEGFKQLLATYFGRVNATATRYVENDMSYLILK